MTSQSTTGPGQRSRLQRVTAPDYLAALAGADATHIRAMRDEPSGGADDIALDVETARLPDLDEHIP